MTRRLPVYILADCSESMAGPGIDEINRGIKTIVSTLQSNPMALETVHLSLITFSRYAKQVVPLTEILSFQAPHLSVRPGTALGAATQLLLQCMQREVVKASPVTKGDYKPLVFLFTDGQPTDDWKSAVAMFKKANSPKVANVYAIGCGPDVDTSILRELTDIVLNMNNMSPDAWQKVFVWLSASVSSASVKLGAGDGTSPISMPELPTELSFVDPNSEIRPEGGPRQVFLQVICRSSKRPYLMRFARKGSRGKYSAICSHAIDSIEEGDGDHLPPINSNLLDGVPACPHCGNQIAAVCPCGAIFCDSPMNRSPVTCPKCYSTLGFDQGGGSFSVQRSQG